MRKLRFPVVFFLAAGCIESYEFVIEDPSPSVVIEAQISDKSFNDTRLHPSDGRYFTAKISTTGDVTNHRPVPVTGALVQLENNVGQQWTYTEGEKGVYFLEDEEFRAHAGERYRLRVSVSENQVFESRWESLPGYVVPVMGDIGFEEDEEQMFVMEANEWVVRSFQVVKANIQVPVNNAGETIYYRWSYAPMWIFKAPLSSVISPGHICWATDANYLISYGLQQDLIGGYAKNIFSIKTVRNERIFEKFSVLVTQYAMTQDVFNFWKEMQDQNESSAMIDTPPYNLKTNLTSVTGGKSPVGYFGVVQEQAKRWYFSRHELSYFVPNTLRDDCLANYGGPPAPECFDCRSYSFGITTNKKPAWWP